jgi:hypothetical protein
MAEDVSNEDELHNWWCENLKRILAEKTAAENATLKEKIVKGAKTNEVIYNLELQKALGKKRYKKTITNVNLRIEEAKQKAENDIEQILNISKKNGEAEAILAYEKLVLSLYNKNYRGKTKFTKLIVDKHLVYGYNLYQRTIKGKISHLKTANLKRRVLAETFYFKNQEEIEDIDLSQSPQNIAQHILSIKYHCAPGTIRNALSKLKK